MSFSAVLDRFDDWINPIVVKELRQAVKSRLVVVILMVFLLLMLLVLGGSLIFQEAGGDSMGQNWSVGARVFAALQHILLPTLMLVVPAYAAIRMGSERGDNNVDLLYVSTLRPSAIISGKFFASLMLAVLVFSIFAPFMTFTYLLRGIDLPTIGFVLWIDALAMVGATMTALFVASIPGPRAAKFFLAFGGFIGLFAIYANLAWVSNMLIVNPGELSDELGRPWLVLAAMTALILGLTVLVYFYSVALISPPSSNRIMPVRVCVLGFWLLSGAAMFGWVWAMDWSRMMGLDRLMPIGIWVFFNMAVLSIQFVISVCERDSWGPRMARTIPKNPVLRLVAFLFYTGSAGGVLFTLLLMAATVAIGIGWRDLAPDPGPHGFGVRNMNGVLGMMGAVALYTVCYALSAALVRYYFLADHIRVGYTWLIAALLCGIGSFLPSVVAYMLFYDQIRNSHESGWWMIANPFMAVIEMGSLPYRGASDTYLFLMWWFLGTWFVLVFALSCFWIGAQVARFRPFRKAAVPASLPPVTVEPLTASPPLLEPINPTAVTGDAALPPLAVPPADPNAVTQG